MMRYEPKRILLCIFKGLCGRFLATAHIQQSKVILEKQLVTELSVYY